MPDRRSRPPFANALFFPAATLYGAVAVLWWTGGFTGLLAAPPGLATPSGHAHEMLFGYAFAVVAGYLLGPQRLLVTLPLLGLWLGARAGFLLWPGGGFGAACATAFAVGVAARVVPRFRRARKWRNRAVAPVVVGFGALAAAADLTFATTAAQRLPLIALVLLSVLLFFMGGRIIAPAIAGHLTRHGRPLEARVQPRVEGAGLLGLLAALALLSFPDPTARAAAGWLLTGVGLLTMLRLARWRPWHCRDRNDLLVLVLGYGWLAVGLLLLGLALTVNGPVSGALHALTVGALGTLTVAVMLRTRLLFRFRDANVSPAAHLAAMLMSAAALVRLAAVAPSSAATLLQVAALLWSAALLIALVVLVRATVRD